MIKLFENTDERQFMWEHMGDLDEGRKNLGGEMPVIAYRLFQFTLKDELIRRYGLEETVDIFRKGGELAGREFAQNMLDLSLPINRFFAHLQDVLEKTKIGVLRFEKFDPSTGKAILTVSEDLDCSGLPVTGETVCNYDEGFIAGILKAYTKKNYVVTEIDCWASGARVCRFEALVKE